MQAKLQNKKRFTCFHNTVNTAKGTDSKQTFKSIFGLQSAMQPVSGDLAEVGLVVPQNQ